MRSIWLSVCWVVVSAASGAAQSSLVSVSEEMPRVELSVGAAAMEFGPGRDFERRFTELGFNFDDGRTAFPHTSPPSLLPGVFAQAHVASSVHTMIGVLVSAVQTETEGRAADGGAAVMYATVLTRAVVVSYRPNPWLMIGAGPALHRRTAGFQSRSEVGGEAPGWLVSAEAKFERGRRSPGHAPGFGYALVQYRHAPPLSLPPMMTRVTGRAHVTVLDWPAQTVRTSHWMFGLGVGFEI